MNKKAVDAINPFLKEHLLNKEGSIVKKSIVVVGLALMLALQSCGTTGSGVLYIEPSVQKQDVTIRKVAIIPNRLPLNLQDPEKWRRYNWKVAREEFTKRGFEVVDYDVSVKTFEKSGLPVEDTKASRDKYVDLAQQLGVDAIVLPYYGTFATVKNFLFFTNVAYIGVGTFQIFLTDKNEFFTRTDISGKNQYTSGLGLLIGIPLGFADPVAGLVATGVITLFDLVQAFRSSDSRWRAAFKKGIQEGLKPFFVAYPAPSKVGFSASRPSTSEVAPKPPSTPKRAAPSVVLRSVSKMISSGEAIKTTFASYDFYDAKANPAGKGLTNQYESQALQNAAVVVDNATGLMWQQAGSEKALDTQASGEYIRKLNEEAFGGFKDWRLPTLEEAMSLVEAKTASGNLYIDPLFDRKQQEVWTSDIFSDESRWAVNFKTGGCTAYKFYSKVARWSPKGAYVRAVRTL
jgi:hypothetical protein